jgi:hypothetical protein
MNKYTKNRFGYERNTSKKPFRYKTMNKNDKMRNRFSDLPAYFCKSLSRGLPEQCYILKNDIYFKNIKKP